ncbi:IS110 family transposase [Candidatus Bathyarchaeota archaeon]|nr:IS110 family transposase [Candidatus Bathyarchaeota archaeon]
MNSLPLSYVPPQDIAVLREKVRRRSFLVGQQTKFKIKIRSVLTYEGVKPPVEYGLFTRMGREWLRGLGLGPVDSYLRMMEPLRTEIRLLSLEMRHIAADDEDVRLLMTIPGVGYYIALLVKAEIGDIGRFHSGDQLVSFAGLAPFTHSSGGITHHGRITKEGSRWLRWAMVEAAMVEAAMVHFRFDTPVTRAYHRIAERRGMGKAKVAAARMLLLVCRSVLKNRRPYFNSVHGQA